METINILVLSDIEASGEWVATQALISEIKEERPKMNFFLVAYGKKTMLLEKKIFKKIVLLDKPRLLPPFRYYRQILMELVGGVRKINASKKIGIKFDLIVSTEYSLFLSSKFALPFCKSIFYFHGLRHFYNLSLNNFNFYLFLRKTLERFALALSDKIAVPSKPAQKILELELGILSKIKKVFIIPNIVRDSFLKKYSQKEMDYLKIKSGLPRNKKIVLYVGRITEKKGLENLIKAFVLLGAKLKNVILLFVFPSFNFNRRVFDEIKRAVELNKLDNRVFFLKDIFEENLSKIYQMADCAVLPSEFEMSSLFLLEALNARLPIFSTKSGDAKIILSKIDPFLILENDRPYEIYRKLYSFFEKPPGWINEKKTKMTKLSQSLIPKKSVQDFLGLLD